VESFRFYNKLTHFCAQVCKPGANPTIASYKASAVKIYKASAVKIYKASAVKIYKSTRELNYSIAF
jgi:hypothetical protein